MISRIIGRFPEVRTHPEIADRQSGLCKPLNSVLVSSMAGLVSGYNHPDYCSKKNIIPAASVQNDFETFVAYTIGLVGCLECFCDSGIYNLTAFEISAKIVYVVCAKMENSRKVLWLWMTGLVERSLELRLALPLGWQSGY